MRISLDVESMTLREVEDFEVASGLTIGDIGPGKKTPARALRAIVWIVQRRQDPAFTFEDAGEVRITDLDFEAPANPT